MIRCILLEALCPFCSAAVLLAATAHPLAAQSAAALTNSGFEDGGAGWKASAEDQAGELSRVLPEAAHSGGAGLRVAQEEGGPGSWFQSARVPVAPGHSYRLDFQARCLEDSGVGVWVQFFDASGMEIKLPQQLTKLVPGNSREWRGYSLDFSAPERASSLTLAVHAFSHRTCLADFDDFQLTETIAAAADPTPAGTPATRAPVPDPKRVEEIAAMLEREPRGVAPAFDNRAAWNKLAELEDFKTKTVQRAERIMEEPIPGITDAQWDEAIRTAERKHDKVLDRRRFRLATFMLAEGMENQGRFVQPILKEIEAICGERTWILPAHQSFTGSNDLGSAMTSWSLATALGMLGDRMPADQRKQIKDRIIKRVVAPYLEQTRDPSLKRDWWRADPNNWNAVVHAGIVGSALAVVDSPQERAEVLAAAEMELPLYLAGFNKDGYSQEGMGYWKYGFGHFTLLGEAVLSATNGRLDFLKDPVARRVAEFPWRFELAPGIYPAYGDCLLLEQPPSWLYNILSARYGTGAGNKPTFPLDGTFANFLYAWGISLGFQAPEGTPRTNLPRNLRDWFPDSQVLVSRPAPGGPDVAVSLRGGTNGTSHGHHDLGQFIVTLRGKPILVDPGVTDYNGQTFSAQRFDNQIINSYGHSVPVIAGKLQGNGPSFATKVISTTFEDASDSVVLSLKGAYDVFSLDELTRKLEHNRSEGSVTISDRMRASKPLTFATALITYGQAREESPGVWIVTQDGQSLRVCFDAGGAAFTVTPETLKDSARAGRVNRIGIALRDPSPDVTFTTKITPLP